MEIIIGKDAGFCFGVQNAVENAEKELKEKDNLYCLGEIVHNKNVVKKLEDEGMKFIDNLDENTTNGETIIRAHGIPKETYKKAEEMNIKLKDLTCPKVLAIHKIVSNYKDKEFYIFIIGSKVHPEIIGTASYCGENNFSIIENEQDISYALEKLKKSKKENLAVVAQTTYSMEKFSKIIEIIKNEIKNIPKIKNVEIRNTICNATKIRQEETEELSKNVDYMIIIGGKNSSNTRKLYEIAQKNCKNTLLVESAEEITENEINKIKKLEKSKENFKIGIMAGASTPKESIENVESKLNNL